MLAEVIKEMEHEFDRATLFNDPMSPATLTVSLKRWRDAIVEAEGEIVSAMSVAACLDHDSEIKELREAVADLEERIRKVKEIL